MSLKFYLKRLFISASLIIFSQSSIASVLFKWDQEQYARIKGYPSIQAGCDGYRNMGHVYSTEMIATLVSETRANCKGYRDGVMRVDAYLTRVTFNCPFGDNGSACNASCDAPSTMVDGQCVVPVNECAGLSGTSATWKKVWANEQAYEADPAKPKCTTSQDGCSIEICSGSYPMQCGVSGLTGEFACFGDGVFTGDQQDASSGGDVDGCEGDACQPPPPVTSEQTQQCTPNNAGSFTCTSTSGSSQYALSQCTVGSTGGQTGWVCVKPDYVPEASTNTRDDVVTSTDNGDGTTTTNTTSTTNNTHCKAGDCTTTSTTTTTTTTKDADGNTLEENKTCTGPNCDKPTNETGEDEAEDNAVPSAYAPPDASGALPEIGDGEAATYSETMENFTSRVNGSPIVSGLSGITVPSGGSCGLGSLQLFGKSVDTSSFCEIAPSVLSGLRYLFLAIWAWAAIRLLFTA